MYSAQQMSSLTCPREKFLGTVRLNLVAHFNTVFYDFLVNTCIVKCTVRPGIPQWWPKKCRPVSCIRKLVCFISGTCKNCGGQILEDFSGYLPIEPH